MNPENSNNHNLLSGVAVKETSLPAGFYRLTIIEALGVIFAVAVSFAYFYYTRGGYVPYLGITVSFSALCAAVFLFSFLSLLGFMLTKKTGLLALLTLLQILGLAIAFFDNTRAWWTAIAIALLAMAAGTAHARREMDNMVYLSFYRISSLYFSKLVFAMAVLAAVFYYPAWEKNAQPIPKSAFDQFFQVSSGMMNAFSIPTSSSTTMRDFIAETVTRQLDQDPAFQKLSPVLKEQQIRKTIANLTEKTQSSLGMGSITPDTKISEAAFRYVNQWINNLRKQFSSWFYLGWTVLAFIFLFSIGKLAAYFASAASFVLIQLFLALKFMKIHSEPSSREIMGF